MHSRTFVRSIQRASIVLSALCLLYVPSISHAATARPTCSLTAETSVGKETTTRTADVLLTQGDSLTITWESTGATSAERGNGNFIPLSGTSTHIPQKTSTYSYHFSDGNYRVTCSIKVHVVAGAFSESTLTTQSTKPTISGTASGTKSVQVQIFKEGSTKSLYLSKVIKVKNGVWETKVSKKLAKGSYDVVLLGEKKIALNTIAERTLTIGTVAKKVEKTSGTIVVIPVPLLSGGTARGGSSIALSYLQALNVGKETTTLKGFIVKQNGSASTDTIMQLTISDDSGTFRNTVTRSGNTSLFTNGTAFIPLEVPIPAGQMRLFTIKALLTNPISAHLGKQFKIDIVGVEASANIKSTLPIRGTTWTIGL